MECKICKAQAQIGNVCNGCLAVRGAMARNMTYGKYIASGFMDILRYQSRETDTKMINCKHCGKPFIPSRRTQIYCSYPCQKNRYLAPTRICCVCGAEYRARSGSQRTCGPSCSAEYKMHKYLYVEEK